MMLFTLAHPRILILEDPLRPGAWFYRCALSGPDIGCTKRCVAVLAGSRIITVGDGQLQARNVVPALCSTHRKLHQLEKNKEKYESAVACYLKNPYSVIRLAGCEKINLELLLSLTKSKPLSSPKKMSAKQQELYNLLSYDREQWSKLMYEDPRSFLGLQRQLHIRIARRASMNREDLLLLHFLGIQEFRVRDQYRASTGADPVSGSEEHAKFLEEVAKDIQAVRSVYRLHQELCCAKSEEKRPTELEIALKQYEKMIRRIRKGRTPNIICEDLSSYRCVAMMNERLVTNGDAQYYDFRLLELGNMTENGSS